MHLWAHLVGPYIIIRYVILYDFVDTECYLNLNYSITSGTQDDKARLCTGQNSEHKQWTNTFYLNNSWRKFTCSRVLYTCYFCTVCTQTLQNSFLLLAHLFIHKTTASSKQKMAVQQSNQLWLLFNREIDQSLCQEGGNVSLRNLALDKSF